MGHDAAIKSYRRIFRGTAYPPDLTRSGGLTPRNARDVTRAPAAAMSRLHEAPQPKPLDRVRTGIENELGAIAGRLADLGVDLGANPDTGALPPATLHKDASNPAITNVMRGSVTVAAIERVNESRWVLTDHATGTTTAHRSRKAALAALGVA